MISVQAWTSTASMNISNRAGMECCEQMASMNTTMNSSAGMGLHGKHEHEPLHGHRLCGQTPSVSMTKDLFDVLALSYRN